MLPLIRSHAAHERGEADIDVAALQAALDRRPAVLTGWVAVLSGELVGYATATVDFSTWTGRPLLHLDCLFVQPDRRGRGIGAILLATVRAHAKERQIAQVQWQTPAWNEDAIRFYRREGASVLPKARFALASMEPPGPRAPATPVPARPSGA